MTDSPRLTLVNARTVEEIQEAVARHEWWQTHMEDEDERDACPADMIPSEAQLIEFVHTGEPNEEASRRLFAVFNHLSTVFGEMRAGWLAATATSPTDPDLYRPMLFAFVGSRTPSPEVMTPFEVGNAVFPQNPEEIWGSAADLEAAGIEIPSEPHGRLHSLAEVHFLWLAISAEDRPSHPLAPIVRAWQEWKADQPRPGRDFKPKQKASLPRIHHVQEHELPGLAQLSRDDTPREPWLPMFEPQIAVNPSWLLWLYDQCGGRNITGKRGANWSFRLFIYAFLHLHNHDRDGKWRSRQFPQETVIDWLHPNGWGNRRRDFERFPESLRTINERLSTMPIGKGWLNLIGTSYSPKHKAVEFNLRLPPSAANGARVEWPALLDSGTVSDTRFRAHLAAAAFLDKSAREGHGITAEIGKAFRDDTGKLKRRKGGKIIRSTTELEANPAARFVRPLSDRDLTAMIGLDPDDRKHRLRSREAFEGLNRARIIDLQHERRGARIFEPRKQLIIDG